MGFYGNKFLNTGYSEININEFFDILNEQQLLFEDTFALAIPNQSNINNTSTEDTKKKLLDIIKNIFDKVVSKIKEIIDNFIDFIKSIEEKINHDEIVKKFARGITWKDVETAYQKGWKGIPENRYFAKMDEDQLVQNKNNLDHIVYRMADRNGLDLKSLSDEIEKMKEIKDINEAKKLYHEHLSRINKAREYISFSADNNIYTMNNKQNGYYKLDARNFQMIENSSINSRSIIKDIKDQQQKITDRMKRENIDPLKREIEYNLKSTADNAEFLKIENYYIKTKLAYNNFILQSTIQSINHVLINVKQKININTNLYLYIARSIRPYISKSNNENNTESENK